MSMLSSFAISAIISNNPSIITQSQLPHITAPPELRIRYPAPLPQDPSDPDQCSSQAAQSASQAIQQATQQASQSIQQAQQSASQAAQQASQSASQAIQQYSNQASQSIAAASRSVSSAISSASSAIASAQSSADQAVSRANASMMSAQASATSAQADASNAVLQAGAAVAAATGSAAAAGSSFLQAAAAATRSASAIGAAAASQVAQANQAVQASQVTAVTATQAAVAIVGSIIASTLITMLVYFLVIRHKKKAKKRSRERQRSPGGADRYFRDGKYLSQKTAMTDEPEYDTRPSSKETGFSRSGATKQVPANLDDIGIKTTTVKWNPSKPPKAPTLGSWLKVQEDISPFGPIKLPGETKTPSPSEETSKPKSQTIEKLKTPLTDASATASDSTISAALNPRILSYMGKKSTAAVNPSNPQKVVAEPKSPPTPVISPETSNTKGPYVDVKYRESKASVWTDDVPYSAQSPPLQSPPRIRKVGSTPLGLTPVNQMSLPPPKNPIRNTAEWLAARQEQRESNPNRMSLGGRGPWIPPRKSRPSTGLPGNPRSGLPGGPGSNRPIRSMEVEVGYVEGLNRFLPDGRMSTLSGTESRSSRNTPGVGKAM